MSQRLRGLFLLTFIVGSLCACPSLPPSNATNVNQLHPNDIKVVMALGDSITAGFGLMGRDTDYLLDEFRGQSWSIGGDEGAITLPNYFSQYRSDIQGAAYGKHLFELPGWEYYANDVCDAAQSNADTTNLIDQLQYLQTVIQNNPNIDIEKDWKILTILIGANDACPLCSLFSDHTITPDEAAKIYSDNMDVTLAYVQDNFPRTLVNILSMFNISQVYNVSLNANYCSDFHDIVPVECPCAFDSDYAKRTFLDTTLQKYDDAVYLLAKKYQAMNDPGFTVTIQPFTRYFKIPNLQFLSTLDCFHPSLEAHQLLATATWNSLLTPGPQKVNMNPFAAAICPTPSTLLYTNFP